MAAVSDGIAIEVVESEQIGIEETGRPRAWEDVPGADRFDEPLRPLHLVGALVAGQALLLLGREVVGDREPDRARELQQLRVERAGRPQRVEVARPRVVLIEHPRRPVVEDDRGVAERTVGRRSHREHGHAEPIEVESLAVGRPHEVPEAERLELAREEVDAELGEQHPGLFVHVAREPGRVEVIAVEVRDVEVVAVAEALPVELGVVREREPRREVRRVHPRVAQDAARGRVDPHARMAGTRDPHRASFRSTGSAATTLPEGRVDAAASAARARLIRS